MYNLVCTQGLEPRLTGSKPVVLPLDDTQLMAEDRVIETQTVKFATLSRRAQSLIDLSSIWLGDLDSNQDDDAQNVAAYH